MLRLDKGRLDLDELAMQDRGRRASGHATIRRDGDAATLTGALALDVGRARTAWILGRASGGSLDFASTGRSPAALINGLAGAGTVNFTGAALARSDPAALDRVVAKAQNPDAPVDETNIAFAFGNELNRGPLPVPDGSAPIALSGGVMKVGPISIPRRSGDGALSADLDLRKLSGGTRLTLTSSASNLKFWSGPPPSAVVAVDNALRRRSGSSTSAPFPPRSRRRRSRARPTASQQWKPTFASALSSTGVSRASDSWIAGSRRSRTSKSSRIAAEGAARNTCARWRKRRRRPSSKQQRGRGSCRPQRQRRRRRRRKKRRPRRQRRTRRPPTARGRSRPKHPTATRRQPTRLRSRPRRRRRATNSAPMAPAAPMPPPRPKVRSTPVEPAARRALLIGMGVALGLEHEHPNGRRQIGVAARGVDSRSQPD